MQLLCNQKKATAFRTIEFIARLIAPWCYQSGLHFFTILCGPADQSRMSEPLQARISEASDSSLPNDERGAIRTAFRHVLNNEISAG